MGRHVAGGDEGDCLHGGDGIDALYGGNDADDVDGEDKVYLDSNYISDLGSNGALAAVKFRKDHNSQDSDDRILYERDNGKLSRSRWPRRQRPLN